MKSLRAYECKWCGKLFKYKEACLSHEKRCSHNVYRFTCEDCKNAILEFNDIGRSKVVGCKENHKPSFEQFENCPSKNIWS